MTKNPSNASRLWFVLWAILGLVAVGRLGQLSRFMTTVEATEYALSPRLRAVEGEPLKPFFPLHSCFTAYMVAADAAAEGEQNIYRTDLYRGEHADGRIHRELGETLRVDSYEYPPPFLLLPWSLYRIAGDFFAARTLFFWLNVALFLLCLFCLSRGSAGRERSASRGHAWLAFPLVMGATTTLASLQVGNVHLLVIMLSILGMLAAETNRPRLGGALLAFATLTKIFPGMLLVLLLARGKSKAVLWTLYSGLAYALVTLVLFGLQPFKAFFGHQFGQLVTGDAFGFGFTSPGPMLKNTSIQGLPFKLQALGLLEHPAPVGRALTWVFGVALLALVFWCGRRVTKYRTAHLISGPQLDLGLWLAVLVLSQMRSPFIPWFYWSFAVLWLLAVRFASTASNLVRTGLLLAWVFLATPMPMPYGPTGEWMDSLVSVLGLLFACGMALWTILSKAPTPGGFRPATSAGSVAASDLD